jgi:hypothetical protein
VALAFFIHTGEPVQAEPKCTVGLKSLIGHKKGFKTEVLKPLMAEPSAKAGPTIL